MKNPPEELKNEPLEQMKSTESLKRERPKHKPEKNKSVYQKTALEIAKNRIAKHKKAKEQALAEKAKKRMDPSSLNCWEQNQ